MQAMRRWMVERVHSSWCIAALCAGFVIGVSLAVAITVWVWCVVVSFLALIGCLWARWRILVPCMLLAGAMLGLGYGGIHRQEQVRASPLIGATVQIEGTIREDTSVGSRGSLVMQLNYLKMGGRDVAGSIWVSTLEKADVRRGDIVQIEGLLDEGFATYIGMIREARILNLERPSAGDMGRVFRDWFSGIVRQGIPNPQASLGLGYLTGQKSALPEDLSEALQIAGLTHIVVASGYNLTILVRLARRLFVRLSKFLAAFSAGLMIVSFVMVTGLSPSMTRAGLVSGLSLLAWYYGRRFHPLVLLPFAACITVLIQPSYAWGDMGWQLSFVAFAGVMIVAPLLQAYFYGDKPPGTIRQVLGETVAAHIVTLPITVPAFGVVSNVAIIANLMIVPLVPLAMLLTFATGVVGLVAPPLVELAGIPATWLLTYMTTTAMTVSQFSWAQIEFQPQVWMVIAYIALLVLACVYMWRKTGYSLRSGSIVE